MDEKFIPDSRKSLLDSIANSIKKHRESQNDLALNFICTHNSRRSQFAQIWSSLFTHIHQLPFKNFSGGMEVTACNPRTLEALKELGFQIQTQEGENPRSNVSSAEEMNLDQLWSKVYDDPSNADQFIAFMTCSNADENCPLVLGALERISLNYEDPKHFDDTHLETQMYVAKGFEIGNELKYIYSRL